MTTEDVVVFTAAASSPESAWRRLGGESSAWVMLANANDLDSLRASRKDLAFVRSLGDVPLVVATYMSMPGDELSAKQITKALGVDSAVPVLPCHLRDRESVFAVVRAALDLVQCLSARAEFVIVPRGRDNSVTQSSRPRLERRKDTTPCTTPATACAVCAAPRRSATCCARPRSSSTT